MLAKAINVLDPRNPPMPSSIRAAALMFVLGASTIGRAQTPEVKPADPGPPPPVQLTAQQDHQRIMDLLGITSLRRGADGSPTSPNAANYDESKANPYPALPDPLVLKDGGKVTTTEAWWNQRRPEIVED